MCYHMVLRVSWAKWAIMVYEYTATVAVIPPSAAYVGILQIFLEIMPFKWAVCSSLWHCCVSLEQNDVLGNELSFIFIYFCSFLNPSTTPRRFSLLCQTISNCVSFLLLSTTKHCEWNHMRRLSWQQTHHADKPRHAKSGLKMLRLK